jgi:hypothetical protein
MKTVVELLTMLTDELERRWATDEAVVQRITFAREDMPAVSNGIRELLKLAAKPQSRLLADACDALDELVSVAKCADPKSTCGVHNPNWPQEARYILKAPGKDPLWVCDRHFLTELDKALDA